MGRLGPDQSRRDNAWGAPVQPKAPRTPWRAKPLSPKIVTTHHTAAKYPSAKSLYRDNRDLFSESKANSASPPKKKRPCGREKWATQRRKVQLAYSTIKPKPKKAPSVPRGGAWEERVIQGTTHFEKFYDRGDLPVCVGAYSLLTARCVDR